MSGFDALPDELVLYVLAFLEGTDLVAVAQVSHRLRVLSCDAQYARPLVRIGDFPVTSATSGAFTYLCEARGRVFDSGACSVRIGTQDLHMRVHAYPAIARTDDKRVYMYTARVFHASGSTGSVGPLIGLLRKGDRLVSASGLYWIKTPRVPPPLCE